MLKRKERFKSRRSGSLYLSPTKTIYLFRCSDSGLYAFTADPKGHVLPSRIYPQIDWRFQRSVTLRLDGNSPKWKILRAMLDAIAKHGFHLMRASQTIDGSMTGKKFLAYIEQCLAPTLKRKDIVMIDNLPIAMIQKGFDGLQPWRAAATDPERP
jgi:hypothetical protein